MLRRGMVLAVLLLALVGGSAAAQARPLKVVATFSILAGITQDIAGPAAEVVALVGPDGDAHLFEPSPANVKALSEADLVVANGLGLEPWLDRLVAAAGARGKLVLASAGVTPRMEDRAADPHAWQDLANGRRYAANIAQALAAAAPEQGAAITARAAAYDHRLDQLDGWVRAQIATLPVAQRRIITTHDAFGYFGQAYGVTLLAAQGLSTEAEPTSRDVARLVRQIKQAKVRAVFLENMSDPRLIRALAHDAGAVVGGTLYADALSAADGPAPSYEAMFRHNVAVLVAAMAKN
ncbi:metal ABC transporter solute-binding protein, Zn/Mn family [Phaeospirillum tilakii]|uniref:Metal ABC transporter solute-binding protein, Zn/Mn family n=1 Tax=Phaeospirillum tilakii TaxID=741673 RepID=A0ABW5C5F0_9PROT